MIDSASAALAADRQKAKMLTFFCVLGLAGFLINLLAGWALWTYNRDKNVRLPTYDQFVFELKRTSAEKIPTLATDLFERWSACVGAQAGWSQVTTHALITSSVVGAALFALCAALSWQIYRRITSTQASWAPPQPPDRLDE